MNQPLKCWKCGREILVTAEELDWVSCWDCYEATCATMKTVDQSRLVKGTWLEGTPNDTTKTN